MERIIPCIMLIDDDLATTVYNEIIINDYGCTTEIVTYHSAEAALNYLSTPFNNEKRNPNLILLDINMPRMNGWEFLDTYNQFSAEQKRENVIIMLSTTADYHEHNKVAEYPVLKGIKSKPLTFHNLEEILEIYFQEQQVKL